MSTPQERAKAEKDKRRAELARRETDGVDEVASRYAGTEVRRRQVNDPPNPRADLNAGYDSRMGSGTPPPSSPAMQTIVSVPASETAKWLRGEAVDFMEHATDPAVRDRYAEFKGRMRAATQNAVDGFLEQLEVDSGQTRQRLFDLAQAGFDGDKRSGELAITLMEELMRTGFGLGAR